MAQYVVQTGDTWESIAAAQLGNETVAAALAEANGSRADLEPLAGITIELTTGSADGADRTGLSRQISQTFDIESFVQFGGLETRAAFAQTIPRGSYALCARGFIDEAFTGDVPISIAVVMPDPVGDLLLCTFDNNGDGAGILGLDGESFPRQFGAVSGGSPVMISDDLVPSIRMTSGTDITLVTTGRITITLYYVVPAA